MLLASGDLNLEMGGPSFVPRVSTEALEGLSRRDQDWQESSEEQRRRRSVYMMSKRSRILPLMTTFDFCDTTRPCAQRDVTTVPTQALALLNNDFVHERSEQLARRIEHNVVGGDREKIRWAWRYALGRRPTATELTQALTHLEQQTVHFRQELKRGESVDQPPTVATNASARTAKQYALASLCHVLLNTNEFIYVD